MESKKATRDLTSYLIIVCICTTCYFLIDIFLLSTHVLKFSAFVGIKNVLPIILGMFYGPVGTIGCVLGCVFTHCIINTQFNDFLIEMISIILVSNLSFFIWYFKKKDDRMSLKKKADYYRFGIIVLSSSLISALVALLLKGTHAAVEAFFGYFVMGIFIGIPIIIIVTSVLWVERLSPKSISSYPYFERIIDSTPESFIDFNEQLELFAAKLPMKRLFEIENCVEEVMILVKDNVPGFELRVRVQIDDSVSIRFSYPGDKYNPLHFEKNSEVGESSGIKMIAYRALRASYRYVKRHTTNYIHIVM